MSCDCQEPTPFVVLLLNPALPIEGEIQILRERIDLIIMAMQRRRQPRDHRMERILRGREAEGMRAANPCLIGSQVQTAGT